MTSDLEHRRRSELHRAGQSIAKWMIGETKSFDVEYWKSNWPLLNHVDTVQAILKERHYFFRSQPSRSNAWALIMQVDAGWQVVRELGEKKLKNSALKAAYLPPAYEDVPESSPHSYSTDADAFDLLFWVFSLHSVLRHPNVDNVEELKKLHLDPWPNGDSLRLLEAAVVVNSQLVIVQHFFSLGTGFEGDVAAKAKTARQANIDLD